jgi:tRNA (guanine37-N1)-methyltransferase
MRFDIFSLFPEVFYSYLNTSILQRAQECNAIDVHTHNIRDWAIDKHHTTDDAPYGGGGGMVMKPEPAFTAVIKVLGSPPACPVILLSPQGRTFTQKIAFELTQYDRLALFCGRYESVDERIRQHLVSDSLSIGDYVLTGGELPALVIIDAVTRLLPGVLGDPQAAIDDSYATGLLEYPHYTRPPQFHGWEVPDVLLSGNHAEIKRWRRHEALRRTLENRPDMLATADLSQADLAFLEKLGYIPDKPTNSLSHD